MTITYELGGALYINVTNRCTCDCEFCVRGRRDEVNGADSLWLEREPSVDEIIADVLSRDLGKYGELVFCGYGEPLLRFDDCMEVCGAVKGAFPAAKIRVNTNGHASIALNRDVTPEMKGLVDALSISLNAHNAAEYNRSCRCVYGEEGFFAMLDFTEEARKYVGDVTMSIVEGTADAEKCREIAANLGVKFRVRGKIC